MTLPRITCPRCGREVVQRKDGEPKNHYPPVDQLVRRNGVVLWCQKKG